MRKTVQLNPMEMAKKIRANQNGGVGGEVEASDVFFDNTSTQLTSTDVQGALEEVDEALTSTDERLIAGSTPFYFDMHDGVYGWNSDEERGAQTFHPFNQGGAVSITSIIIDANQVSDVTEKTYDREDTRGAQIFNRGEGAFTYYQSGDLGGEEWVVIDFGEAKKFGYMSFTQLEASNVDNVDILVSGSTDGDTFTDITTIEYDADECKGSLSGTYRYLKLSADIEEGKCLTIKKMVIATVE